MSSHPRAQIELPYTEAEVRFYQRKYPQLQIRLDLDREALRLKIREARRLDRRLEDKESED